MGKKLKIVIAEDGTELGKSCEKALKSYGMDVIMCDKSGTQLLEKIKSEKPDVVLADIFMQNLDILGVLDAIHKTDAASRPMVMAMSSFDNPRLEKETLEAGASYYFLKPFDINTMAERIIRLSGWRNEISPVVVKDNVVTDPELELMGDRNHSSNRSSGAYKGIPLFAGGNNSFGQKQRDNKFRNQAFVPDGRKAPRDNLLPRGKGNTPRNRGAWDRDDIVF